MKGQRFYTPEQEKMIVDLYVNQQKSQSFVCKMVHTTPNTLKKYLTSQGYKIRTFSEAASLSNKNRAKNKNKDYFKVESHNMAWILGFLAADGTIRKAKNEIKVTLSSVDREILEKIREEINIETAVKDYTSSNGYDCSTLAWTCEEHKRDLQKYNIIPEKTFVMMPPTALNPQYYIDFIRGYFDGDGSINYLKGNDALRWQVCGATKEMLQWIIDVLYEQYNIPKVNVLEQHRTEHTLYYFQYSTNATKAIYQILYSPNSLYLKRKKEKYENDISLHETAISQSER